MDYKDYLSGFGNGIDKDVESIKMRNEMFLKQRMPNTKKKPTDITEQVTHRKKGKHGILMTDIPALAKYCCVKKDAVQKVLEEYCEGCELVGIHWDILDASKENYDYIFEEDDTWNAYSRIIDDYIMGMGLDAGEHLGLFIIGGDNVIPMPKTDCPLPELTNGSPLDADFLYCLSEGGDVRCNVGRLPLENGKVSDGLERIEEYFLRSLGEYDGVGLDVENGIMTSTESWLPSSREMIRTLPIEELVPEFDCTDRNMFVSPNLDVTNRDTQSKFNEAISCADFLMFNLHGSDDAAYSSYYGEDIHHRAYPEAFSIQNISKTSAKIINSTACYGGRYIGYKRDQSLLLQGIYGSALLYTASCTTALGRGNGLSEAVDLLLPAGMSETLLKLYTLYLYKGRNAGEALLKAKLDYYNTCKDVDGESESMATVLMFNLYGNPLLNMKAKMEKEEFGSGTSKSINNDVQGAAADFKISTGIESAVVGVSNEVRTLVDESLNDIKATIMDTLYKHFDLEPEDFIEMNSIEVDGQDKGYVLTYAKNVGPFKRKVFAKTDLAGKVVDIIHTK